MRPSQLRKIIQKRPTKAYSKGELFHSLDFNEELYVVKSGFVKRYSISEQNKKSIESIYGPGYFFPLSPIFMNLYNYDLNQKTYTYVYQAMTDTELYSIETKELVELLQKKPELYSDLLYETGRRLKVDVDRLTSNALRTSYKKVVHQIFSLAEEFADMDGPGIQMSAQLPMPLSPSDLGEQLNLDAAVVANILNKLKSQGLIAVKQGLINVPDIELLRDAYLR